MGAELVTSGELCLHVVDVQQSLMAKIHQADKIAETVELLVRCAAILNVPVIANTQYRKGLGPYVGNIETLLPDELQIDKVEFNAVANDKTADCFAGLAPKPRTVALVGVETHICIYQTAMGYLGMGLDVWVVADGVSSRSRVNHEMGLQVLRQRGVTVGPAEMLIYELLGRAGTSEFKQILPLIIAQGK